MPFVDQRQEHYHVFGHSQGDLLDSLLVSSPAEIPLSPPRALPIRMRSLPVGDPQMHSVHS